MINIIMFTIFIILSFFIGMITGLCIINKNTNDGELIVTQDEEGIYLSLKISDEDIINKQNVHFKVTRK